MPMPNAVVSQSPGGRRVSQERNRQRQHEKEVRKTSIKESTIFWQKWFKNNGKLRKHSLVEQENWENPHGEKGPRRAVCVFA